MSRRHWCKAHHVFQVIRVVDRDHVLAISGNDHNDVRTRIRLTSDVIGWRDVTVDSTTADKTAGDAAISDKTAADKIGSDKVRMTPAPKALREPFRPPSQQAWCASRGGQRDVDGCFQLGAFTLNSRAHLRKDR